MKKLSQKELNQGIGSQIYRIRVARKLSQEALSEAVGVSRVFISNLENGNYSAKIDTYYRIACALDISLYELFRTNENKGWFEDILVLLSDCSEEEIRAFYEILHVIRIQFTLLNK